MKASDLLAKLSGDLPIAALGEFNDDLEEKNNTQGAVHGLLLASDNCDEILDLLLEKHTPSELTTIFTTLGHILLNVAGELKEFTPVGLHITRQLLHNHEANLYRLLLPTNTNKTTKSVLRCLTGMVMIGGEAASEVLMTLNWPAINISFIANRQNKNDVRDVRAWCIYLILAFLNATDDPLIIKQFLQKKDLLPAIFPGLVWDPCERVINVLKVMHDSVLLNPDVTKSMKVSIFTPETTKPLLDLYNWMGPVGKLAKGGSLEDMENQVAEEIHRERAQVREVLHKFMLTLCSSFKHGVIFREKMQEGQGRIESNNWFTYKIVTNLKSAWESPEGRELMSSVLGACPDLLKPYLLSIKDSMTPRPTTAFVSLIKMLTQILNHQEPWKKLKTKGLAGVVSCLLPRPFNHHYFQSLLRSSHKTIRHCGIMLILAVLSKTRDTVENIVNSSALSQEVKHHTRKNLIDLVFKVLKSADPVIHCWNVASGQEEAGGQGDEENMAQTETAEQVHQVTELLSVAKVLTLYVELLPNQAIYEAINPVEMLQLVQMLPLDSNNNSECFKAKLELQVLCLGFLAGSKHSQEFVVDSTITGEDDYRHLEKNVLYQLITTYSQSKREIVANEDNCLMFSVTEKCLSILSNSLAKVGLSSHYDGNVKFWLRHIPSDGAKLSSFLTRIIQKTVSSLINYTDALIAIGTKSKEHLNEGQVNSILNELETMEVTDNEDVTTLSISLPFSRLILTAVDLLQTESDSDYIQYFSNVITDYIHSLNDPELLATYLLENEKVMTSTLIEYLRSWCRGSTARFQTHTELDANANLSEILRYLFMTNNWTSVEAQLEASSLKEIIDKEDIDLVVSQLILYLHLDSNAEKKGKKLQKRYTHILKQICSILEEDPAHKLVIETVLEHPQILLNYKPFSPKKSPMTALAEDFVELVLQKHPTLASKTVPYFSYILKAIEFPIDKRNYNVDYWTPLAPFIMSENTVASHEAVEQMLITCLKAPFYASDSLGRLVLELIKLLTKTTSAKRKLKAKSAQFLFTKFLEWGRSPTQGFESKEVITKHLELLLLQVLSSEAIKQLTSGDLKSLLRCEPPCPALCCHIMRQHPQHGHVFAKFLKKHGTVLPTQAPLLAQLLKDDETTEVANVALAKISKALKTWALQVDGDDDETSLLILHAFDTGLLDENTLTEVCRKLYEVMATPKQLPPKKLLSLLPAFQKLSENGPVLPSIGLPEEHLSLLHICLSCIRNTYQKENKDTNLLLSVAKLLNEVLPKVNQHSLQDSLRNNKLWSSFAKQVLRNGISDQSVGPEMIHALRQLCSVLYKKCETFEEEGNNILPIETLYQMINGHSQYLTLMFNREETWERLKEQVVVLQQTLVDCESTVCQESHVPILLGAYGASMSVVDQHLLKLLFTYERKGFMTSYQPVLWGEVAVTHFGVKSASVGFFRDPVPEQVLGQLDMDRVMHTCYNFDINLPLEPTEILKEDRSVYDVRFLLPLMMYLAEESLTEIDYADSGAVALGFVAMTSHQREVWGTGAAILRCMVEKMERSRHYRLRLPWLWLVGVVSCAFEGKQRRLPALTTHFLIQASQLITQPGHPMYKPALNYLFLQPAFKLYFVPELYRLYNSQHLSDNREHRSFLLSLLSSGIRQKLDYKISQRTFTSTLMFGMLQAPTADAELKVQVLEVLESMVRIPIGAVELVRNQNLLTVLPLVGLAGNTSDTAAAATSGHPLLMSAVVRVLDALWATVIDTTTRRDIIANEHSEESYFQEPDDVYQAKRKISHENDETSNKKIKIDSESAGTDDLYGNILDPDVEVKDTYMNGDEISKSHFSEQKMLPPLFVHEYLNSLMLLLPPVITSAPPTTSAKHLELVANVVQYIGTISEVSSRKHKFRLATLLPEIIKQQVYARVHWDILYDQLQEYLSDDEEARLLGIKAREFQAKWRSEPLSDVLKEGLHTPKNEDGNNDYEKLKEAAFKLLKELE